MADKKLESETGGTKISDADLKMLFRILDSIKFGSVTLIIQDGKIVQMEKNEKVRLK